MTRVVHVTSAHPPFDIRIFHKECKALAEAGYEVVLVASHIKDETVGSVRVHSIPLSKGRLARMLQGSWRAYRAASLERAEIYHLHDPELLPFGKILQWTGKRVIFDMHENVPKQILTKSWLPRTIRRPLAALYRVAERFLLRGMDIIFAERSYHHDYLWVKRYTEVLNLSRAKEMEAIAEPKYPVPTLGYIGAVSADRGISTIIEAIKILRDRGIIVNFECVGSLSTEYAEHLEDVVNRSGLKGQIRIHGYMQAVEGWHLMSACHIGTAILKPLPNYVDSMPTKLFEYMALGIPVIVSDFPLYRQILGEAGCGVTVSPEDPEAVAVAIQWMVDNPDKAREMAQRGRVAAVSKWNWDVEKQKLIEFYRS